METKSIFDNDFTTDELVAIKRCLEAEKYLQVWQNNAGLLESISFLGSLIEKVTEKMTTVVYIRVLDETVNWTIEHDKDILVNYQDGRKTLDETIEWLKGTIFTGRTLIFKLFENGTWRNLK
jgi:hypothetical protein